MIQEKSKPWLLHNPKEYLRDYYNEINEEDMALYKFWCEAASFLPTGSSMMEIGSGPGLYSVIPFVENYEILLLTDYLQSNLDEIVLSLKEHPEGFDWKPHIELVFHLKDKPITFQAIQKYFNLIQSKTQLKIYDMTSPAKKTDLYKPFDLVTAHFCIEAISNSLLEWQTLLKNCLSWVAPGGHFLMSACTQLRINRIYNPNHLSNTFSGLTLKNILNTLQVLKCKVVKIKSIPTPHQLYYSGNILILAKL